MPRYHGILVIVVITLLYPHHGRGQMVRSPFSTFGIGQPFTQALFHNQGMGGTGIAQPQYYFLNNQNPALLVFNTFSVFASGFSAESNIVRSDTVSNRNSSGNLTYLVAAFPIKPRHWTTSFGIMPYTRVDFKFIYLDFLRDVNNNIIDSIAIRESGIGGFNQLYWSNGFRLHENWSAGIQMAHIFGTINNDYANNLINLNAPTPFLIAVEEQTRGKGFRFTGGLSFSKDSLGRRKDFVFSAGLTYALLTRLSSDKITRYERRNTSNDPITRDTLIYRSGNTTLPAEYQFGFAFSKLAKWTLSTEAAFQDWGQFRSLNQDDEGSLTRAWRVALGGEFTPDYLSEKLLDRITYRAGLRYESTPFLVNGNQVKDFGINFGLSLPTGRSSIDLAFTAGKRGSRAETGLDEQYFRLYVGFTFNEMWFIRRKFD